MPAAKVKVFSGTGTKHEIDPATLNNPRTVREAIQQYAAQHKDEDLADIISGPVAIERFETAADGSQREEMLSPEEDFRNFLEEAQESEILLGIHRRHSGGGFVDRLASGFTRNPVSVGEAAPVTGSGSPPAHTLDISSRALDKVALACRVQARSELMGYYLSRDGRRIDDVLFPPQSASISYCSVDPRDTVRANIEAERQGMTIVGAFHSHAGAAVFTSTTDEMQNEELSREKCGLTLETVRRYRGTVQPIVAEGAAEEGGEA